MPFVFLISFNPIIPAALAQTKGTNGDIASNSQTLTPSSPITTESEEPLKEHDALINSKSTGRYTYEYFVLAKPVTPIIFISLIELDSQQLQPQNIEISSQTMEKTQTDANELLHPVHGSNNPSLNKTKTTSTFISGMYQKKLFVFDKPLIILMPFIFTMLI